jgi:hypothetical protein
MDGRFSAVVLSGVLTGSEPTSWGIHPALWKLEHREQVRAEKLVYKRFGGIGPFPMTATTAACFVAPSRQHGRSEALAFGAAGCYATMLAITLNGNMPINLRVFRWDEDLGDPEEWRRRRRRRDRLHNLRIPLDLAGFVLITLAALDQNRGRPSQKGRCVRHAQ